MAKSLMPYFFERPEKQLSGLIPQFFLTPFEEELALDSSVDKGIRIYEDKGRLHVEVPMPGLKSDDIEVSLNKGVLLVKGQSSEKEEDKERKYYRSSKRSYSYSLSLPNQIDEKLEPDAVYSNGILDISLQIARKDEAKKIAVKSGQ